MSVRKISIDLYWVKCCDHSSAFNFEWVFFDLADKKNNYKSLDEIEFHQDLIIYYSVSSPGSSPKLMDSAVTTLVPFFYKVFFILSGHKDNYKSLNEFEL